MPRKVNSLPYFVVFFILSILLILFGTTGIFDGLMGAVNRGADPVRNATFNILTLHSFRNKTIESLQSQNLNLLSENARNKSLLTDDKALKDQFASSGNNSLNLLPAKVVGYPGFLPGISSPQFLIIDKGKLDGLHQGEAVILKNNLVGKLSEVFENYSKVEITTSTNSSFTAKTGENGVVNGVAKGKGDSIIFDNVLLSQNLRKYDLVLTKGDLTGNGSGYPADLVVGKIISIEKKPSDLFQRAQVESFIDFKNLSWVFILK